MKKIKQIDEVIEKIRYFKYQNQDTIDNDLESEEKALLWSRKIIMFNSRRDAKEIIMEEIRLFHIYCELYYNRPLYLRSLQCKIQTLRWVLS